MSELSKKMRSLFDTWPRALPYTVKTSDDVGAYEQAAAAAILNRHRATPRQDLLALCSEIESLEKENARLKLIAENAPLLDAMGRGVGNPLDRLENENAAIRVEIEILRRERSSLIKKGDSQ